MRIPFTNIYIGRQAPGSPQASEAPAGAEVVVQPMRAGEALAVTDSDVYAAGYSGGYETPIRALVARLSTDGLDTRTLLELRHMIRGNVPDVQTAIIMRRALEGELLIESDDAGLQDELRAFCKEVPVGYIGGTASASGLDAYLDMMANASDEYGLAVGELIFAGRRIERLVCPDMRTFDIEPAGGMYTLVQDQGGKRVPIDGGTIQSLTFRIDSSSKWPPAMIVGGELIAEALLRMLTSINTIWLKAGDPPLVYSIQYDKDARVAMASSGTDAGGSSVVIDQNVLVLQQAIRAVKKARSQGMMAEIVFSVVGGELKIDSVFGNPTTQGLVKEAEPHFRIASGLLAQMSEVPSWVFASAANRSEGLGSNRANAEASLAFAAAERRRRKLAALARSILNTYILGERSARGLDNFRLAWTAPSIIDEKLIQETRQAQASADATFVRASFEMFNPEGAPGPEDPNNPGAVDPFTPDQREYLERRGVLDPKDPEA